MRRLCLFALAGHDAWSQRAQHPHRGAVPGRRQRRHPGAAARRARRQDPGAVGRSSRTGRAAARRSPTRRWRARRPTATRWSSTAIRSSSIPHLRKVNYDPITSFEPVCYLRELAAGLSSSTPTRPIKTLADFIAGTKAQAGHAGVRRPSVPPPPSTSASSSSGRVEDRRHLRAVSRRRAGDDRAARRPRARRCCTNYSEVGRAVARRHRAGAGLDVGEAHPAAAGRADGR